MLARREEGNLAQRPTGQLRKALELIDGASSVDDARRRIERAIAEIDRHPVEEPTGAALRGRTFYDRLIESMLDQVKRAESREALVEMTIRALGEDAAARAGICYLVFEAYVRPSGTISDLKIISSEAMHRKRVENFAKSQLENLAKSQLILDVMVNLESHEFLATTSLRDTTYFGEFDDLIDARRHDAWICILPLPPAEALRPCRMLVAIYPMMGSDSAPALPRGALQEWRTLTMLRVAYEMLNHQLASTGERVAQERRDILHELAPGLVNHEINQQLKVLDESTNVINWALRRIEPSLEVGDSNLSAAADGLENVLEAVARLHRIADAFNNLERRPTDAPVSLGDLLAEIATIMHFKTAQVGALLDIQGDVETQVVTDASLVEHVLINIIANALESIEHNTGPRPRLPIIKVVCRNIDDAVEIDLTNNGPAIDVLRPEQVFEKGFTTKARGVGHGLGLYNCKIIMSYLGGNIRVLDNDALPASFGAGFRLLLPINRLGNDDVLPPVTKIRRKQNA